MAVNEDLRSYLQGLYELPDEEYEALRENLSKSTYKFESEDQLKQRYPGATYAQYEVPRYDNILITDTGIGFRNPGSGSNYLFNKYIKDPEFNRLSADYDNRIYPAFQTTKPSDEAAYAALLAESRSNTEAQRALAQQYNALYSGKAVEGWEENAFYAKDINLPTRQNLAALVQQSKQGVDSSKQFLDDYRQSVGPRGESLIAQAGPRGMDRAPGTYHPSNIIPLITPGSRFSDKEGYMIRDPFKNSPQTGPGLSQGPRGENIGEIAVQYGDGAPKKERWMIQLERDYNKIKDKPFNPGTPKPGRGMGDTWEGPVRDAQAPAFDEQKALLAKQAADEYRRRGQVEDPFRASAIG